MACQRRSPSTIRSSRNSMPGSAKTSAALLNAMPCLAWLARSFSVFHSNRTVIRIVSRSERVARIDAGARPKWRRRIRNDDPACVRDGDWARNWAPARGKRMFQAGASASGWGAVRFQGRWRRSRGDRGDRAVGGCAGMRDTGRRRYIRLDIIEPCGPCAFLETR